MGVFNLRDGTDRLIGHPAQPSRRSARAGGPPAHRGGRLAHVGRWFTQAGGPSAWVGRRSTNPGRRFAAVGRPSASPGRRFAAVGRPSASPRKRLAALGRPSASLGGSTFYRSEPAVPPGERWKKGPISVRASGRGARRPGIPGWHRNGRSSPCGRTRWLKDHVISPVGKQGRASIGSANPRSNR
jgi:hypothetical protein